MVVLDGSVEEEEGLDDDDGSVEEEEGLDDGSAVVVVGTLGQHFTAIATASLIGTLLQFCRKQGKSAGFLQWYL